MILRSRLISFLFLCILQLIALEGYGKENVQTRFWLQLEEGTPHIIKQKNMEQFFNHERIDSILIFLLTDSLEKKISKHNRHVVFKTGTLTTKFQTVPVTRKEGEIIELKIPDKSTVFPNTILLFIYDWEIKFTEPGTDLNLPTSESVTTIPGRMASISQKGNFVLVNLRHQEIIHYAKFDDKFDIQPNEKNTALPKLIHYMVQKIFNKSF